MDGIRIINQGRDAGEFLSHQVEALKKYIGIVRNDKQENAWIQQTSDSILRGLKEGEVDQSVVREFHYRSNLSWGAEIEARPYFDKVFPQVRQI